MLIADATDIIRPGIAIVGTMDGVTTALVAFVLFCMAFPDRVKSRPQFYAGFSFVLLIILLHMLSLILSMASGFQTVSAVATGACQVIAIILFMLSVGGITARQLASDMARSYEVIRRGETEKEIIIPIGDQKQEGL